MTFRGPSLVPEVFQGMAGQGSIDTSGSQVEDIYRRMGRQRFDRLGIL
ncbi:MAG TPA: hypothetical protein PK156_39585 [Polyangium sp.]|nr:hypothetical protein [Polyangium sp.]